MDILGAVIMGVVIVRMGMAVIMVVIGLLSAMMFAFHTGCSTSANCTHHTTSRSFIRNSSPPAGTSLPPPQSGQGSSRAAITTSLAQS